MYFYYEKCKKQYPLNTHAIRCSCGGLFRLHKDPEDVVPQDVSIGHMVTPLVPMNVGGIEVLLKLENLQPTGSYKDRGAATLVSVAKSLGITKIALDSAGYAGASVAAYAAAAGMDCRVYVPEGVPDGARQQLQTYGAEVEVVKGTRMDACAEVKKHLGSSWYYASPAYNPLFAEGVKSLAHELYEQLGGKVPEYVFVPAGNGSLVIGLYLGFMEIGRLPRIVAVQTDGCAPLYRAFMEKRGIPVEEEENGIVFDDPNFSIERPKRLQEMLFAIESSGGDVITVTAAQEKAGARLELLLDVLPDVIKRGALCKTQLQPFSPALDLHNLIMHNDCRFSSLSYDLHDLTTAHHFLSPPSWLKPKAASRILRPIGTADWEP